ncbi:MAG: TetR/AcrR family transcriptional regulator [Wenzhouxiangellaceae bacterium]
MTNPTRQRLLESAEILFSQQGFTATPLRQITEHAKANLAAVNYHFGSKIALIREVLRARLDQLNDERIRRLDELEQAATPASVEQLLAALIEPALMMSRDDNLGGIRFVRLLARAYAENDRELHRFLRHHYSHVMRRFASALAAALPAMEPMSLRWHLDFVIGSLTYAMADFSGHFSHMNQIHIDASVIAEHLVSFAAAGLHAANSNAMPQPRLVTPGRS